MLPMKPKSYLTFLSVALMALLVGLIPLFSNIQRASGQESTPVSCTFNADKYPKINLRAGPGISYERLGTLILGDTLAVTGRGVGTDGYVWWKGGDTWVRSDLGTSDCPSLCGDGVCEYGETTSSCAQDCTGSTSSGSTTDTTSGGTTGTEATGTGCDFASCEACYEAFPCWPNPCTQTECTFNEYGCPSCTTAP